MKISINMNHNYNFFGDSPGVKNENPSDHPEVRQRNSLPAFNSLFPDMDIWKSMNNKDFVKVHTVRETEGDDEDEENKKKEKKRSPKKREKKKGEERKSDEEKKGGNK